MDIDDQKKTEILLLLEVYVIKVNIFANIHVTMKYFDFSN